MNEKKELQKNFALEQNYRFLTPDTVLFELAMRNGLTVTSLDKMILQAAEEFRNAIKNNKIL